MRFSIPIVGLITLAQVAWSVSDDERWGHEFYAPSFGTVNALAFATNGDLVCGGSFQGVAGIPNTQNIARWDGTNWWSVGGGLPGANIFAVGLMGSDVIVGGNFTSVAGQPMTNLARWNGTNWSAIGGGVTGGSVRALAVHNGELVVGGLFTHAGSNIVGYIAAWNGAAWNDLSGGVQASSPSSVAVPVQSLLSLNGALYVGGRFFSAGGVTANNVAHWNGGAWEALGTGLENGVDSTPGGGTSSGVTSLAADTNGILYLGGSFIKAGTNTVNCIAAWNGSTWSGLHGGVFDPLGAVVRSLVALDSGLYVSGTFNLAGTNLISGLARWDGSDWLPVSAPVRHPMFSIAAQGTRMVVFGTLENVVTSASPSQRGLARFDGQRWSVMGGGVAGSTGSAELQTVVMGTSQVLVSGFFDVVDFQGTREIAAAWDGSGWNRPGDGLRVALSQSERFIHDYLDVENLTYAAGAVSGGNTVLVLTNDAWMDMGAPSGNLGLSLAQYQGRIFLGHQSGIAQWTGTEWTNVGAGLNGAVYALAVAGDDLYAGGLFSNSGPTVVNNLARWDGTNWSPLGSGMNALVYTLAIRGGEVIAGGDFTQAGGLPALRVAKWNSSGWSNLGDGFNNGANATRVYGLKVVSDGRVFAAGDFRYSGTNVVNRVAVWDGVNWNTLGSGLNDSVFSMDGDETNLYLGGAFTTAGGVPSLRFARWRIPQSLHVCIAATLDPTQVILLVSGEPETRFALEVSSDFQHWNSVVTNTLNDSAMQLPVMVDAATATFFRLRSVP